MLNKIKLKMNSLIFLLVPISGLIIWILMFIVKRYKSNILGICRKYFNRGTLIELIWTIKPALILIFISFPSFKLLYLLDEGKDSFLAEYEEGHEWYLSFRYPDYYDDVNNAFFLVFRGDGFTCHNGIYKINDPTGVGPIGYKQLALSGSSFQPYAANLSNAMQHGVSSGNNINPTQRMNPSKFGHDEMTFFAEFIHSIYSRRRIDQYWNSKKIRMDLYLLH